jgi:hypothetical protein
MWFRNVMIAASLGMLSACASGTTDTSISQADSFVNARGETAFFFDTENLPTPFLKPSVGVAVSSEFFIADTAESDKELSKHRGTFAPEVLNSTVLEASSSQNVAVNSITGSNIVDNNAFTNSSGLVNLIQNSGNNVVIQSSTIVNLTFQ